MHHIFSAWRDKKIIIIGDVMIDRYLYGSVERISPEAPVPVLNLTKQQDSLGGAANVALNIQALGAKPIVAGVMGKDADAQSLLSLFQQQKLETSCLLEDSNRPTTVKTRVSSSGQQMIRIDKETQHDLSPYLSQNLFKLVENHIQMYSVDAIVFQDYNKGILHHHNIHSFMELAQKNNIPTIVDPKVKNFLSYKKVTLFKPNLKEIQAQCPFDITPNCIETLRKADTFLRNQLQHNITLITLSEYGVYISDGNEDHIVPTQKRNIVDVCGAGDTVLSIAALAMTDECIDMVSLAQLSNLAGGQVCESLGVVAVNKDKLQMDWNKIKTS